ncbi:PASTA domain-containing protein [Nonomuraea sp. NPDC050783]|uniref:PASTA domain-containing protein n=1 Tax=Nonomuraea sp. NPDC050783 TaxID=3154634 RepID=UPI0034672266
MRYGTAARMLVAGVLAAGAAVAAVPVLPGAAVAVAPASPEPPVDSSFPTDELTPDVTPADTPADTPTPDETRTCEPLSGTHDAVPMGHPPDVMGLTRDVATAVLEQDGFTVTARPSGAAGGATVTDQTPTHEELVACGSDVTIDLETPITPPPPVVRQVVVPDLHGLTRKAARARLDDAGLELAVGGGRSGRVSDQDPAAGSLADPGDTVTVTLTGTTGPGASPSPADTVPTGNAGSEVIDPDERDASGGLTAPVGLAAVVAVLAAGGWALRRARRRPGERADERVNERAGTLVCVAHADPDPHLEIRDLAPALRIELVCHHDGGLQEIREIVR